MPYLKYGVSYSVVEHHLNIMETVAPPPLPDLDAANSFASGMLDAYDTFGISGAVLEIVPMIDIVVNGKPLARWQVVENIPGCTPESDPEVYDTRSEALARADELEGGVAELGLWRVVEVTPVF